MSVRKLLSALEWTQEQRATLRHHLAPVYKYFLRLRNTKHKDKNKYKFKRNKWEGGIKERLIKRYPEGFKEVKTTFYPMVSLSSIRFFSLKF